MWRCRLIGSRTLFKKTQNGLLLVNLGLLLVALFYVADLATMYVLPMVTSMDKAMEVMEALHRNINWLVILIAAIAISIGCIELVVELQRRETKVQRLIDSNIIGISIWVLITSSLTRTKPFSPSLDTAVTISSLDA